MTASRRTPFRRILVANRGEIALRILRSAHALGHETVAVYSAADDGAPHMRQADRAVAIGAAEPAASYLNIAALIDAARRSGADAVHPGYGFLAENAAFAQACRDAGLVFIGPSPESIRAMGDKAAAKRLMAQAGVPCIPGYDGADQDDGTLQAQAARVGFPLMVKATAGGGGRGMRLVARPDDFLPALHSARSEALHAFGDATVLLERAIERPRHVEIQLLADRHGHAVSLGERDCSVQRRHQKIIEEAPSPAVDAALRERMGAAAVAAARAIGYEGAGTLEFLLDGDGAFWFMEMNTRLQVEHPVTEAVTGEDLVAWQLRIAAGEPLALDAAALQPRGHAIEVRLCAEDPAAGFVPCSGTLVRWQPSTPLRVEHALESGSAIPPHYDSMIAKLVAHGSSREEARRRLVRGLRETVALGVATNRDFLIRCLEHEEFVSGGATTAFVARHGAALATPDGETLSRLRALAALMFSRDPQAPALVPVPGPRLDARVVLHAADQVHTVQLVPEADGTVRASCGDAVHALQLLQADSGTLRFACDGLVQGGAWWREGDRLWLDVDGTALLFKDRSRAPAQGAARGAADGLLRAGMAGRVVAVHAQLGAAVQAGQPLVTLEAMKMEHVHTAPRAGMLAALHARIGDQAVSGGVLAEITGPVAS